MTVPSPIAKAVHATNSAVTDYAFNFKVFSENRLSVVIVNPATYLETPLKLGTDYAVSGLNNDVGGTVSLTAAGKAKAGTGQRLAILRAGPFVQETDFITLGGMPAHVVEWGYDQAAMERQELREALGRTLRFPVSDPGPYPPANVWLKEVENNSAAAQAAAGAVKVSEIAAKGSAEAAKVSETAAKSSQTAAGQSETKAAGSAGRAAAAAGEAEGSAASAARSATEAGAYRDQARTRAEEALANRNQAQSAAEAAAGSALEAKASGEGAAGSRDQAGRSAEAAATAAREAAAAVQGVGEVLGRVEAAGQAAAAGIERAAQDGLAGIEDEVEAAAARAGEAVAERLAEAARQGGAARDEAVSASDSAQKWAVNPPDDPVAAGLFSAYHWAKKAEEVVTEGLTEASQGEADQGVAAGRYVSPSRLSGLTPDFSGGGFRWIPAAAPAEDKTSEGRYYVTPGRLSAELAHKVDVSAGKGLSANDYTTGEKNKLAGVEEGAQKNVVFSVNEKTGAVVLSKGDLGLGNVDNTSDADKTVAAAARLAAARAIQTNLASAAPGSFDGGGDATVGVTGILPVANGGTGAATAEGARDNLGLTAKLTGDLLIYVRATGNDNNEGLTTGKALKTLDGALTRLRSLESRGQAATIDLGSGAWTCPTLSPQSLGDFRRLTIRGQGTGSVINGGDGQGLRFENLKGDFAVETLKIKQGAAGALQVTASETVRVSGLTVEAAVSGAEMITSSRGVLEISGATTINNPLSKTAASLLRCERAGCLSLAGTLTISNNITVTGASVWAADQSLVEFSATVVSGQKAAGARYRAANNSTINTNGGGAALLPGTTDGSAVNGGQYV